MDTSSDSPINNIVEFARRTTLQYFSQLQNGCGRFPGSCTNKYCASSRDFVLESKKDAMREAVRLAQAHMTENHLCELIPSISVKELHDLMNACNEMNDKDPFQRKLESILSNADALDALFLIEDPENSKPQRLPAKKLDLSQLAQFHEALFIWESDEQITAFIFNCLKRLLEKRPKEVQSQNIHHMLFYLLLPSITDMRYRNTSQELFSRIASLNDQLIQSFDNVLKGLSSQTFVDCVRRLQEYISICLISGELSSNDDVSTHSAILVLERFYFANRTKCYLKSTDFYNEVVSERLDLRRDFHAWMSSGRTATRSRVIFCGHPFILPLEMKNDIIQARNSTLMREVARQSLQISRSISAVYLLIQVKRENLIQDTIHSLLCVSDEMDYKKQLKVIFSGEEGIDEGGVQKEFFQLICQELFDPKYGMFVHDETSRTTWFNGHSLETTQEFELLGMIFGLAIYNGNLLDVHFPAALYKKLVGAPIGMSDLEDVNPDLAVGLEALLNFDGDVEDIFCRTFAVETEVFGSIHTYELKPEGANIPVTNENRQEFAFLYVDYLLNKSVQPQFDAFHKGFWRVVGQGFKMFDYDEVELLICGRNELDFKDLRSGARYDGEYNENSPVIINLWEVLESFTEEEKKKFLAFTTGCDRVPLKGLSDLHLTVASTGIETDRLPSAHTCFNILVLPKYPTKEVLREKLLTAIKYSTGFGLK